MSWQLNPIIIADITRQALRRYWDISIGDWDTRRVDDTGDRGPWEDQPWLARETAAQPGQTFERVRPDGTKNLYRCTVDGWRIEPDDLTDPHRGTLHQNAANWRGAAVRWRRRLELARAEGDEAAAAQAQDEVDTAERIADVKERYPHVRVLSDHQWSFDPNKGIDGLDDGGQFEHAPTSPEGYRERAQAMRANSEIVELGDPLKAASMRHQAVEFDRKADGKEADEALAAAADDFEKAAAQPHAARPTWCADPTCTTIVNLNDNPSSDRNGEARCPAHPDEHVEHDVDASDGHLDRPPAARPYRPPAKAATPTGSSGASMSGSIGDAAQGIRQSNDTANEANGILQQAIAQLESARGQLQAAVAGSPQADAGESIGMYGQAMEAIRDAQRAVQAAIASAESVAARL